MVTARRSFSMERSLVAIPGTSGWRVGLATGVGRPLCVL